MRVASINNPIGVIITFLSINMSTKLGKIVMFSSGITFLEWHLDINKWIYQSIGLNKANSVQYIKDIFELSLVLLWIINTSRYHCWGGGIQNTRLHTETRASTQTLKRHVGEAILILHALEGYVVIKPNQTIEHTFTL